MMEGGDKRKEEPVLLEMNKEETHKDHCVGERTAMLPTGQHRL